MKKILKLNLLLLLLTIFMFGSVYATSGCNISVHTSKNEYSKNEEISVDVNISNIQSERGIISLGATLQYDKNSLTLLGFEGKNGWETPADGASFNSSNGKIAITRSGLGKNDETVFTVKFKVKDESKANVRISLEDITIGDGVKPSKISAIYKDITIKGANQPSQPDDNNNGNTNDVNNGITNDVNNGNTNSSGTNNPNKNNTNTSNTTTIKTPNKETLKGGELPKAGNSNIIVFVLLGIFVLTSIVLFIKMLKVNKKM